MRALVMMMLFLIPMVSMAGNDKEVVFKSSINCNMCKEKIEKDLPLTKGVKSVSVDVKKKEIKVIYNGDKTSVDKLKAAIAKIGYDADDVLADKKAHDHLPKCCQKSQKCEH